MRLRTIADISTSIRSARLGRGWSQDQLAGRANVSRRWVRYDDAYSAGATPLSVSMPVAVKEHTDAVVTPWLWGLLPDNADVLRRWARQFGTVASSPFALLGTPIGEDCAGGVQFATTSRVADLVEGKGAPCAGSPRTIWPIGSACCGATRLRGSVPTTPDNGVWLVRRPRWPCDGREAGGAKRPGRSPPRTSSNRPRSSMITS